MWKRGKLTLGLGTRITSRTMKSSDSLPEISGRVAEGLQMTDVWVKVGLMKPG
jgi:hypothetical protein